MLMVKRIRQLQGLLVDRRLILIVVRENTLTKPFPNEAPNEMFRCSVKNNCNDFHFTSVYFRCWFFEKYQWKISLVQNRSYTFLWKDFLSCFCEGNLMTEFLESWRNFSKEWTEEKILIWSGVSISRIHEKWIVSAATFVFKWLIDFR